MYYLFIYLFIYSFILKSYTKYNIDRKTENEKKERKQHMQPGYNQTHTLENRSTISSRVNQTGKVNDPSLSNTVSCKRLHIVVMESYVKYTKIV